MQTYKVTVDDIKTIQWYNDKDQLHRIDGPAIERADGTKAWFVNDKPHRLDGPSIERTDVYKEWYVEGKLHRLDGPAREWADGSKEWYVNDKRHRLDGPSVEFTNGYKAWYVEDNYMTEEEFSAYTKPKPTCENKVIDIDGKKYKLVTI